MTDVMEKLRNRMYGGTRERFEEVITYLTNPALDGDEIPPSICEDDIKFALSYRGVPYTHTKYSRSILANLLATNGERWESNLDEWTSAYYCYNPRLRRYFAKLDIKPYEWRDNYVTYKLDAKLLTAIADFTEVKSNDEQ